MKALRDPQCLLGAGLAAIRDQFRVPADFPPDVLAAAESAARRAPTAHADWTDRAFVTLDPARSTDLDQAFAIEPAGADLLQVVREALSAEDVRPLGDRLTVASAEIVPYQVDARLYVYPGPEAEVIAAADEHGMAMILTGRRHFRH